MNNLSKKELTTIVRERLKETKKKLPESKIEEIVNDMFKNQSNLAKVGLNTLHDEVTGRDLSEVNYYDELTETR